jgi:hypothetical protein
MKMPPQMLARYALDPLALDEEIRRHFAIPEDRYYSVARYPEHIAGLITIDQTRTRVPKARKISKSDQATSA